jgi:hypothetical protein
VKTKNIIFNEGVRRPVVDVIKKKNIIWFSLQLIVDVETKNIIFNEGVRN